MNYNLALPFYQFSLQYPDHLAVFSEKGTVTYGELAGISQKIAAWLQHSIKGRPNRVGILASRSIEACAAVLGTCWAGGTYVPISLKLPEERLQEVLALSELDALIVDARGMELLSEKVLLACPKFLLLPDNLPSQEPHKAALPAISVLTALPPIKCQAVSVEPKDIVYIIFTSGTTGIPKGVVIEAEGVHNLLSVMQARYQLIPSDRVSENTDLSFDVSVSNMFMTWGAGATLYIVPSTQAMAPAKFIQNNKLTVWSSVPSIIGFMKKIKALPAGAFPTLRYSLFAGEPISITAAQSWQEAAPNGVVDNLYGPTEATVVCIGQRLTNPPVVTKEREVMGTGIAFPGMEAGIVDENLHFVPRGTHGQLVLSGIQLAKCYFNAPDLTEKRFPTLNGKRWYLTGDMAYQDTTGIFHHLGRIDNQVKVLGNRVELEEIEAHMRAVSGIEMVAAVAWPIIDGRASGVTGFICGPNVQIEPMREALKKRLPAYMVPGVFHILDTLPMNVNDKVDRKALIMLLEGNK